MNVFEIKQEISKTNLTLSAHTPYNEDTHHYLNESFIKKMNKPFFIINTAKENLNTSDLIKGLNLKKYREHVLTY